MGLDDPQTFVTDVFASHARFRPRKEAVVCGDVRRCWHDFDANVSRVAHALIGAGLARGDRVAVMMGNRVEMLEAVFGIVRAGGCAVPLSGLLTGAQLAHLVADSGAIGAFTTADFRAKLDAEARTACLRTDLLIAADVADAGGRAGVAGAVEAAATTGAAEGVPLWRSLDAFVRGMPSTPPPVALRMDDAFNIIYSSGTTGLPKGIVQTHRARQHWAWSNAIELGVRESSRGLTTTSLYSNGTWLTMLPVLWCGGTLVAMPAFDARRFLELVRDERITHTFMVPSQFLMVLAEPTLDTADTTSLESILCAGSPLRPDTKRRVVERFGDRLTELYGFSEGFATMLKPGHPPEKFETVGTPVIGFEVRIVSDDGSELPRGETGEIAGYGAGMMRGYHGRPEQTDALVWRDERGRSFLRSGDIGRLDADGYLSILDRKKDMIASGGFNVFPSDLEQVVAGHEAVLDVTVIGIPHERWGETPLALVIRASGASATELELLAWANERLGKHQRLHAVEFRTAFPRNALGKVLKKDLRAPYWAGTGRSV